MRRGIIHYINNKILKKRHWYSIRIAFVKDGNEIGETCRQAGFTLQEDILSRRVVAKHFGAEIFRDKRAYGCTLEVHIVTYIGKLKDRK